MENNKFLKIQDFIIRLSLIKVEAGQLGLYKTMHELDKATNKVGWEFGDMILKCKKKPS